MAWECDNEDLDQMERGFSQEVLRDELYIPVHKSRGWIRCFVSTDSSSGFRFVHLVEISIRKNDFLFLFIPFVQNVLGGLKKIFTFGKEIR